MRVTLVLVVAICACVATRDEHPVSETDGGGLTGDPDTATASTETMGSAACEPTTAGVFAAVMSEGCDVLGCHGGNQPAAGLDLSVESELESRLVGVASACDGSPIVVAGDPDASLLVRKLEGTQTCGDPMPIGMTLDDELVDCVASWIAGLESSCEQCGGDTCIDVSSDAAHCGVCGRACPSGVPCVDGECACPQDTTLCGDACVDTASDVDHCGGCDEPCDMFCLMGECAADCGTLQACGGACVDTTTDQNHCGGCDQPCGSEQSCVGSECVCTADPVSFSATIAPLLAAECTAMGCHGFPVAQAGLDLRESASYDELVGVASDQCGDRLLVAPGDTANSYLVDKLLGVDLCFGTQMPKAGQSLPEADIAAIEAWICYGALDD